jgi:predicted branched-subunit amino acid permease
MDLAPRFRQGMKAAMPIWIAFVPSSLAWGIAAQAHGLRLEEVLLLSAWVYSGPAQFAVLEPFASGKSSLQVMIAAFLMNLRFLPMSAALAPYFAGARRARLLLACQFLSASSFIVPYLQFQKEREAAASANPPGQGGDGDRNLVFFLGVGMTSFLVWCAGTSVGFGLALGFPPGFEEALKFILPGYFASLLAVEMSGRVMPLICVVSLVAAVFGTTISPGWGWMATALVIAIVSWGLEEWMRRGSLSY